MWMKRVGDLKRFCLKTSFPVKGKDIMLLKWKPIQFFFLILLFFYFMAPSFASGQVNLTFDQTNISVNENAGTVTVGFKLNGPSECTGYYSWGVTTQNGSAVAGIDYETRSDAYSVEHWDYYQPVDYSYSMTIPIIDNCMDDSSRSFSVVFQNASSSESNCEISSGSSVTVTINNDDIPLTTVPASLQNLSGVPGQTLEGSFTISGGLSPYQVYSDNSGLLLEQSGNSVSYQYTIPGNATTGQIINFNIEINDSCGDSLGPNEIFVPMSITVEESLSVNPSSLSLSGLPGDQVTGSVTISGGEPSYSASVTSGPGSASVSNNTATYNYSIPANASPGQLTAQMTVYDSLENSVVVALTITVGEGLGVNPGSLNLSGVPGDQVTGSVTISGGEPSYSASVTAGPGSASVSNNTATYSYSIPANASQGQLTAQMTVYDSFENSVIIPVTITVGEGLGVNPSSLTLSGLPGDQVTGSVTISGGEPSYSASVTTGPGSVSVSNNTATYSYSIPANASEGRLSARIAVYDSAENSVTVPVTINVGKDLSITPDSMNPEGYPGSQVGGSLTLSGGLPPYSASVTGVGSATILNNTVTYSYDIPENASEGQLSAMIIVEDSLGKSKEVAVTITVHPGLKSDPSQANIEGFQGQQVERGLTISGGAKPYGATVEGPGEVNVSDNIVKYSLRVPADAQDGETYKATIKVTDAFDNLISVQIETIVKQFKPFEKLTLTPNQRQVAGTITKMCPALNALPNPTPGQEQLAERCNALVQDSETDPGSVENAIAQITPDEAGTQATLTNKTAVQQMSNVMNRLTALRAGATGFSMSGLSFGVPGENYFASLISDVVASGVLGTEGGLKDIELMKNLGVFMTGRFNFGTRDTSKNQRGFDFDTLGVTAGVDYRFTKDLVFGIAFGYADTGIDYSRSGGDLDIDAWSASLYGNYYVLDNLYLDAIVNLGWNDYNQTRKVTYSLQNDIPIASSQKSDYSGDQYSVSVGVGYELDFNALKLDFTGRIGYLELNVDDYREKDPNNTGLNLYIRDQETDSFTTTLGVQLSYTFNTNIGVFIPKLGAEWEHEFGDDSFLIEGSFVNDPNPANPSVFFLKTDDPSRDYFRLSPGVTMVFPHGISSFINFDCLVGYKDFESYNLSFGVRYEF